MTHEIDPIDVYLDEVCKLLPFTQSNEQMAERWKKTYGIEVSSDLVSALPEKLQVVIAESRSESEMLRTELRSHIDAAVARCEVDGVDHDIAVRQAIKQFGNAQRLNRLLRKKFSGSIKARVDRALRGMEQAKSKREKASGILRICLITWPTTWPVLHAMKLGTTSDTALRWILAVVAGGAFSGWYQNREMRTDRNILSGLQSIFDQADVPGKTVKQRLTSGIARWAINSTARRNSPTARDVARSLFIRIALLVIFWFGPLTSDNKFMLFYLCLAALGYWLGELYATVRENRRTSEA